MRKLTAAILAMIMVLSLVLLPYGQKVEAASDSIKVNAFIKSLVTSLEIPVDNTKKEPYIVAAFFAGLLEGTEFDNKWTANLTRANAAVMLNNADEYLHGDTVDEKLLKIVLEKRISDIDKVSEGQMEAVAKCFAKGIIKGYSNGDYSSDRAFKGSNKLSKSAVETLINLVLNPKDRAKLSPDGQLLRTTDLPNNAKMFSYILASYPNRYYEAKLLFEGVEMRINGVLTTMKSPEDYTYPKDVKKANFYEGYDYTVEMDKYIDTWMDKVYTRVWNTFNVNYKTINSEWVETMAQTDADLYNHEEYLYKKLNNYVTSMKKNKTIVECDKVALDKSSMYYYNGFYYIRCHVHYRIVSSNTKTTYTAEELFGKYLGAYESVLFTREGHSDLRGYKLGEWTNGIFDIGICTGIFGNSGSSFGVVDTDWSPNLFRSIERN